MISDSFGDGPTMVSIQLSLNQLILLGWTNQLYGFQLGGSISWLVQWCFPASIEPSSYSCRIAELCQSLVSYLVHEPGNPMVVGNGWWWLLSGDPDGFGSVPLMIWGHSICMWVFDGVCWYMLLTSKVESLLFSCPNDACRVPHAAYIDYPKNCHEGQRGGAQIWAPMDPHNCEEEHFLCSAGTRKSRNPIVYVSWSSNSSLELIFGW